MHSLKITLLSAGLAVTLTACGSTATAPATGGDGAGTGTGTGAATGGGAAVKADQPKRGGVIRNIQRRDNRGGWDPQGPQAATATQTTGLSMMFNSLVSWPSGPEKIGSDETITPDLAEKWEVSGQDYIFHLKKGVKFHNKPPANGREMTAEDVKYSWERLLKSPNQFKWYYDTVQEMKVEDPYRVRFILKQPDASFLSHMARGLLYVAPKGVAGPPKTKGWLLDDEFAPDKIIGTGPFMFKAHERDVRFSLERNPDYFKNGLPHADGWEYLVVGDSSTQLAMMTAGQADYVTLPAGAVKSFMETNPKMQLSQEEPGSFQGINMRTDKAPFNNVKVRQAIMMAIDQGAIIDTYTGSKSNKFYGGLSATHFGEWYTPPAKLGAAAKIWEYNPEGAKKLLAEAGYPNGFEATFRASNCCLATYQPELLADMLDKVGIKINIDVVEHAVHLQTSDRGEYDSLAHNNLQVVEPDDVWSAFLPGNLKNVNKVDDPKLTDLINKQKRELDPGKRKAIMDDISKYLAEQAYMFRYPSRYNDVVWQPWIKNYRSHGRGNDGRDMEVVWIDRG